MEIYQLGKKGLLTVYKKYNIKTVNTIYMYFICYALYSRNRMKVLFEWTIGQIRINFEILLQCHSHYYSEVLLTYCKSTHPCD